MDTDFPPIPQNAGPLAPPQTDLPRASLAAGHEMTDLHVPRFFLFGAAVLLCLFGVFAGIAILFEGFGWMNHFLDARRARTQPGAISRVHTAPDYQGPLLQALPEEDLHVVQGHANADLRSYGWVDQKQGIVRMPIERAKELIVQRGLPPVSPGLTLEAIQRQRADPQVYGQSLRP